jgi:cytochrome c oxidase cbb3-type subunit 3
MNEERQNGSDTRSDEIAELPHPEAVECDGIREEDNAIPLWFNLSFAATIVFAIVYLPYYHLHLQWSSAGQYAEEVAAAEALREEVRANLPTTNPYGDDASAVAEGKVTFETICSACHKPDGSGLVGPSLVDPYWKYGSDDASLFESVSKGRPLGMPPWEAQLGAERIWKVLAYLETLPRSDEPGVGAPDVAPGS